MYNRILSSEKIFIGTYILSYMYVLVYAQKNIYKDAFTVVTLETWEEGKSSFYFIHSYKA